MTIQLNENNKESENALIHNLLNSKNIMKINDSEQIKLV
jgi:hypothetical protein